jgi:hypothetical protein
MTQSLTRRKLRHPYGLRIPSSDDRLNNGTKSGCLVIATKRVALTKQPLGICCLVKPQLSLGAAKPRQVKAGVLLGFYFMANPLGSGF